MIEVKIREATENITVSAPMGMKINQPHRFLQLYYVESGEVVSDNIYTLIQGDTEKMCDITKSRVRGVGWVNRSEPMYLRTKF